MAEPLPPSAYYDDEPRTFPCENAVESWEEGWSVDDGALLLSQTIVKCIDRELSEMVQRFRGRDEMYDLVLVTLDNLKVCRTEYSLETVVTFQQSEYMYRRKNEQPPMTPENIVTIAELGKEAEKTRLRREKKRKRRKTKMIQNTST